MINIRLAVITDAHNLAEIATKTFRDTFLKYNNKEDIDLYCAEKYSEKIQENEILDVNKTTVICEVDKKIIGYAQINWNVLLDKINIEKQAEIQRFYITEEWQGKGIAQELMQFLLHEITARNIKSAWLGVWEKNSRAITFYKKFGFDEISEHVFILGSDKQRDIILNKLII
jgi:ribosomal protein S18 acetylase RimI-like enzyme